MKKLIICFLFLAGTVLYGQQVINVGTSPNSGTGDPLRTAFQKVNTNFSAVYDSLRKRAPLTGTASGLTVGNVSWIHRGLMNLLSVYSLGDPIHAQHYYGESGAYIFPKQGTYLYNYNDTSYLKTGTIKFTGGNLGYNTGRLGKGWFTDLDISNLPTINGGTLFKTALSLTSSDVGLGNVTNESKATMFNSATFTGNLPQYSTTDTLATQAYIRNAIKDSLDKLIGEGRDIGDIAVLHTDTTNILKPYITSAEARQAINDSLNARIGNGVDIGDIAVLHTDTTALLASLLRKTVAMTTYVSYTDANSDLNLGEKNITTTGNIGASDNIVSNGYFENITLTNPLKGRVNSDSIIWADGALQPTVSIGIKELEVLGSTVKAMTLGMSIGETKASVTMVDNSMKIIPVYLRTPQVITGIKIGMATQGDYTADNYNGVGLYKYNTTLDSLVLVASSTDDGNIWKASSGSMITKAFSSTYSADAGLYYVACLWNNSASNTAPVVYGTTPGIWIGGLLSSGYFVAGSEAGQNTLPSKYKASDINTSSTSYLLFLY